MCLLGLCIVIENHATLCPTKKIIISTSLVGSSVLIETTYFFSCFGTLDSRHFFCLTSFYYRLKKKNNFLFTTTNG